MARQANLLPPRKMRGLGWDGGCRPHFLAGLMVVSTALTPTRGWHPCRPGLRNPVVPPEPPAASGGVAAGEESVAFPNPGLCTHLLIPIFGEMSHCSQSPVYAGEPRWPSFRSSPPVHLPLLDQATPEPHPATSKPAAVWGAQGSLSSPGTLSWHYIPRTSLSHVFLWHPPGCQHPSMSPVADVRGPSTLCRAAGLSLRCSHGSGRVLTGRSWGQRAPWWPPGSGALWGACRGEPLPLLRAPSAPARGVSGAPGSPFP